MTAREVLDMLEGKEVLVTCVNGKLQLKAPAGVLTETLRSQLFEHKETILALIGSQSDAETPAPEAADFEPDPQAQTVEELEARLEAQADSEHYMTLVYLAEACPVTVAGKWTRLDDGRIEASYTRVELIWAMMATGYEPTVDEMALIAES